jgi:GH25 family lysozyme M1 (1,4-beta-N-acetylmuramidase)
MDAFLASETGLAEMRMIDTSHWESYNGGTGLAIAAERHQVQVLYTKITEQRLIDKSVNEWLLAREFGINLGGYHFWRPGDAQLEAKLYLSTRAAFGYIDLPAIMDFEHQANPGAALCLEFWVFADRIEQATGAPIWLYTNANYLPAAEALRAKFRERDVILAAYPTPIVTLSENNQWLKQSYSYQEPNLLGWDPRRVKGWQFTPYGKLGGCTAGGTDLNWYYPNGFPSSPPHVPSPIGLWQATTTGNLNVRSGAGTTYPIVGTLPAGTTVIVDERQNGWAHVVASSGQPLTGWCSETYLRYS